MQLILDCHWLVCVRGEGLTDRSISKSESWRSGSSDWAVCDVFISSALDACSYSHKQPSDWPWSPSDSELKRGFSIATIISAQVLSQSVAYWSVSCFCAPLLAVYNETLLMFALLFIWTVSPFLSHSDYTAEHLLEVIRTVHYLFYFRISKTSHYILMKDYADDALVNCA